MTGTVAPSSRSQAPIQLKDLATRLRQIGEEYPEPLRNRSFGLGRDLVTYDLDLYTDRTAYDIALVVERIGTKGTVVDVGGGFGLFSIGCALLGFRSILMDDFGYLASSPYGKAVFDLIESYGVEIQSRDIVSEGVGLAPNSVNAIGCFHTIEHVHNSPKGFLHECGNALQPGGVLVLAGPNCVNLRKRLTVPLGRGKWSSMGEWYEMPVFRGHVREPDVDDLRYIAKDLGLDRVKIHGRNFIGRRSKKPFIRFAARLVDKPLRLWPALCGDIYVVAQKPGV